jgi:Laminin G domain
MVRGKRHSLRCRTTCFHVRADVIVLYVLSRSVRQVSLNDWHTVHISRTGRNGLLRVDDQPEVKGSSSGSFTQLTLTLDLFVGGHRNFDEVPRYVQVRRGLRGCIQKASVALSNVL